MTDGVPTFPMARDLRCPLDPPPGHRELAPIQRGKIYDGSEPVLISGNELYRRLITDSRVSNDIRRDGYPAMSASFKDVRAKRGMNTFDRRDGQEHEVTRRVVARELTAKRVAVIMPQIEEFLDEIFDEVCAGPQPADLVSQLALPFTSRVLCHLLGIPHADYAHFVGIVSRLVSTASTPDEAAVAHSELRSYVDTLITACERGEGSEGVIHNLVTEQLLSGNMNRDQVVDIAILLLIGGYETSANSMSLGTVTLLTHPAQFADLRDNVDDPKIVASAVEELLRFISITHNGRRRVAKEDIEIDGVTIKAGDGIIFVDDAANRDPSVFGETADDVDIRRDASHHLAFAFGPHHCLGNMLARSELQAFFRTLVKRMPNLRLAVDLSELKFRPTAQIYGVESVPIAW